MSQSTFAVKKILPKTQEEKGRLSLAGCIMAGIGVLLSATGIGAIIGIPIIIAAISNSRREMKEPNQLWEAPCPHCGTLLHVPANLVAADCAACQKHFLIRFNRFEITD